MHTNCSAASLTPTGHSAKRGSKLPLFAWVAHRYCKALPIEKLSNQSYQAPSLPAIALFASKVPLESF